VNQPGSPTTVTTTFVLRFWRKAAVGEICWRGSIEHVQSGEEMAFLDVETMLAFLNRFGIKLEDGETVKPNKLDNR
jgi:hypothetical protein